MKGRAPGAVLGRRKKGMMRVLEKYLFALALAAATE